MHDVNNDFSNHYWTDRCSKGARMHDENGA
jgi:hypothetical protein